MLFMRRGICLNKKTTFFYKGISSDSKKVKGYIKANSKEEALMELKLNEFYIKKIYKDYKLIKEKPIRLELLVNFIEEWINLEKANIVTQDCLEIIKNNATDKKLKMVLTNILINTQLGDFLSTGFLSYEHYFPKLFITQICNGISKGNLYNTLLLLKDYYKNKLIYTNKLKNSLLYPKLLSFLLVIVFLVISKFIIPSFIELFSKSYVEINNITKNVLNIMNFIGNNVIYFFGILIIIILTLKSIKNLYIYRKTADFLKILIFKKYYILYFTSLISSTLCLYWNNGFNKIESISLLEEVIDNVYYKKKIRKMIENIKSGQTLGDSFNESHILDETFCRMIMMGENNNCVENNLMHAANYYKDKMNFYIDKLLKLVEPLFIMVLSVFVLSLILVIFIPILNGFKVVM